MHSTLNFTPLQRLSLCIMTSVFPSAGTNLKNQNRIRALQPLSTQQLQHFLCLWKWIPWTICCGFFYWQHFCNMRLKAYTCWAAGFKWAHPRCMCVACRSVTLLTHVTYPGAKNVSVEWASMTATGAHLLCTSARQGHVNVWKPF